MRRVLARCLLYPALLLAPAPGCQALHRYRPVPVLVRDAETKKPIPGAEVKISYPAAREVLAPWESLGTTEADGIARLRAEPYQETGLVVEATAQGYLFEELSVAAETIEAIEPAHFFEKVEQRPAALVLEMYAEPNPTVELVVPTGYRGLVKVEVQIQEDATFPAGQRCFRYPVSVAGVAQVKGPPFLRRVFSADYRACYADGTPLRQHGDPEEVGLHWLKYDDTDQYFVVGTQRDYDSYRREMRRTGGQSQPARSGTGSGGGGRRGRRSNQSAPQ
jgi:hypothetical protein